MTSPDKPHQFRVKRPQGEPNPKSPFLPPPVGGEVNEADYAPDEPVPSAPPRRSSQGSNPNTQRMEIESAQADAMREEALRVLRENALPKKHESSAIGSESVETPEPKRLIPPTSKNSEYFRVSLASGGIFYEEPTLMVRKISVQDQYLLHQAAIEQNLTMFIDAIDATVQDFDVRQLTVGDFRFLLYWHKLNSYPNTPFNFTWESMYGHKNTYTLTESILKLKAPEITREQYLNDWVAKGYAAPTLRDHEYIREAKLTPQEMWTYERAQYFQGEPDANGIVSWDSRIQRMSDMGIAGLEGLNRFKVVAKHGVEEEVEVRDEMFDAQEWIVELRKRADALEANYNLIHRATPERVFDLFNEVTELRKEAAKFETAIKEGKEVEAEMEVFTISIGLIDFLTGV